MKTGWGYNRHPELDSGSRSRCDPDENRGQFPTLHEGPSVELLGARPSVRASERGPRVAAELSDSKDSYLPGHSRSRSEPTTPIDISAGQDPISTQSKRT